MGRPAPPTDDDPGFSPAEVAAWGDVVDVRERIPLTGGHFVLSAHVETVAGTIRRALQPRGPPTAEIGRSAPGAGLPR